MRTSRAFALAACSLIVIAPAACNRAEKQATAPAEAPAAAPPAATPSLMLGPDATDAQKIASAMTAAPPAVAKDATIIDMAADGSMRELRKGTNGFTCMGDNPATPGPDPMCGDANAMEWAHAWITHAPPPPNKVGFMYMLEGGTDASNTDPYATAPSSANNWVKTGPHVMIVGAPALVQGYPRDPQPDTSRPYVMWPDTPYEHLMIPVS